MGIARRVSVLMAARKLRRTRPLRRGGRSSDAKPNSTSSPHARMATL